MSQPPPFPSLTGELAFDDDKRIAFANETLAKWLGYTPSELIGERIDLLLDGGTRFYFQSQVIPSLKLHGRLEELYLPLRKKDSEALPFLFNMQRSETGERPLNYASLVRMHARAKLEHELLIAKKQAEAADEARSKFLAMMSHELKTPLHAINLSTHLMLEEAVGSLTGDQKELMETAKEASTNLARLIEDILDYAKLQHGNVSVEPTAIYVEEALKRAERLVMPRIKEASIQYQRAPIPSNLTLHADPDRLQQIFLNLLNNAAKFTPEHGRISVGVRASEAQVFIDISDNGCGIANPDLQRIFEPFVQLQSVDREASHVRGSLGLGLAICRQLARAMNGDLTVKSELGKGSCFTIRLPLEETPSIEESLPKAQ